MSGSPSSVRDASILRGAAPSSPDSASGKAASDLVAWYAEGFSDRIGDRLQLFDNTGPGLELLRFNPLLTANPAFEPALRASVESLDDFRHPSYARVRKVTVLEEPRPQLALVSELVSGERLSKVLKAARLSGLRANAGAAIYLLRRLLPPLIELHTRGVAHGLLTHDRIIVSPQGEFFITEHVLPNALATLGLTAGDLWHRFGIATATPGQFDRRTDVMQVALLALTLLLDRPLGPEDYPRGLQPLLREASARLLTGDGIVLQMWFRRALTLEEPAFSDAADAMAALDALLWDAPGQWNAGLLPGATTLAAAPAPAAPVRQEHALVPRPAERSGSILFVPPSTPRPTSPPDPHGVRAVRRLRWAAVVFGLLALAEAVGLVVLLMRGPRAAPDRPVASVATQTAAADSPPRPAADGPTVPPATQSASQPARAEAPVSGLADPPAAPLTADASTSPSTAPPTPAPRTEARAAAARPAVPPRPKPSPAAANCWLAIDSPVEVRIFSDGRLVGAATRGRFPLTPGSHEIILVNEAQQFRSTQTVELEAGATVTITPTIPEP
jgi:hypothetical protein